MSLSLCLVLVGCGDDDTEPAGCASSDECNGGLVCVDRACVPGTDAGETGTDTALPDTSVPDTSVDTGPPMGLGCSADLRDVLGADGSTLRTCADDEGCFDGACVAACDAANATRGTIGCTYRVATPSTWSGILPPCHAVFVANMFPAPAVIGVSRGDETYPVESFGRVVDNARPPTEWDPIPDSGLPEGEVGVLFLSHDPDSVQMRYLTPMSCPVTTAVNESTAIETGTSEAFTITSNIPLRAYDILPFGGALSYVPGASLLMPTNAWDREYVIATPPIGTHSEPGPLWFSVTAHEDGTEVSVQPTVALPASGGAPAISIGATGAVTLDAGEYVKWEVGASDPSGSLVRANKAVSVSSGNRFLRIQRSVTPGGEGAHQQQLPVSALSHEYVVAPFETRRLDAMPEDIPYRVVGVVDGTSLTFDPPIAGAPPTLDRGEVVDFSTTEPFVVSGQDAMHPFTLAQMMRSCRVPGGSRDGATAETEFGFWLGDEEHVPVFPAAQYLSDYVFFSDPSFPTTSLTVTRVADESGAFAPVTVECLGEVTGFAPVGTSGRYEYATVDLVRAGIGAGSCTNGRQAASSDNPFGVVVWGMDSYSSYAYPAGGNAETLADLPPLF